MAWLLGEELGNWEVEIDGGLAQQLEFGDPVEYRFGSLVDSLVHSEDLMERLENVGTWELEGSLVVLAS